MLKIYCSKGVNQCVHLTPVLECPVYVMILYGVCMTLSTFDNSVISPRFYDHVCTSFFLTTCCIIVPSVMYNPIITTSRWNEFKPDVTLMCSMTEWLVSWWRHQMETFSALLAICAGNSPVPVNSPHKGQWRGALMFSLICTRINAWVNNGEASDLRRNRGHYDVTVM